jgi:serine/threonine protein kinase/N-acetylmuramoyl-L-alanine amidase
MNEQPPNTQALPAGTRLEEFVIERILGAGGFGITYLASDVSLGRQVVIKENLPVQFCFRDPRSLTVSPRHTSGEDLDNFQWSLENFSRESAMLASVDHPGIVKVLRSFQAFGTAYFVMPFVEGMALDDLAKKRGDRSFTEVELASLLKDTLSALGYLHDRGIYHRDIKPGNILTTDQGKPVLIDFGSARQRLIERSMTVVESAGYTPFEQLQSRGNVGPWSDLYALGATLVKVMTGEAPPKANDRTMGDPWQPLSGRAELTRRFSPLLLGTLDRALKLPIEERWQNAGDWQKALKSGKVPVAADATNKKELSDEEQKVTGKKHVWPKVVAALMIVGAASGWWLLRSAETDSPVQLVSEPKSGGLVITSEPSGAEVMQGEKPLGKTPLELTGLSGQSRWEGSLKKEGYEVAEILSEVISGETKLVPQIELIPTPQKVIVTSEPSGAEVVEGEKVLGKTPWEGSPRSVGEQIELSLRKDGYDRVELKGEIEFGKTLQIDGKMRPSLQSILVTSEPSGAEVWEGDKALGKTPLNRTEAPGTELKLDIRLVGHHDAKVIGTVKVGEPLKLSVSLIPSNKEKAESTTDSSSDVIDSEKVAGVAEEFKKWHVVAIGDTEYVSIESIQKFYKFPMLDREEDEVILGGRDLMVRFNIGSDSCMMNGIRINLYNNVVAKQDIVWVSKTDLTSVLDPILRPSLVEGAKYFKTVILDPMSGVRNQSGYVPNKKGSYLALKVAQLAESRLFDKGFKVLLTRNSEATIPVGKRVDKVNAVKESAIVIMIGFAAGMKEERGIRTFTCDPTTPDATVSQIEFYAASQCLATALQSQVLRGLGKENTIDLGVSRIRDYSMSRMKHPVVLLEGGFVTHQQETLLLNDEKYTDRLAECIVIAVNSYQKAVNYVAPHEPDLHRNLGYFEYLKKVRDEQFRRKSLIQPQNKK